MRNIRILGHFRPLPLRDPYEWLLPAARVGGIVHDGPIEIGRIEGGNGTWWVPVSAVSLPLILESFVALVVLNIASK